MADAAKSKMDFTLNELTALVNEVVEQITPPKRVKIEKNVHDRLERIKSSIKLISSSLAQCDQQQNVISEKLNTPDQRPNTSNGYSNGVAKSSTPPKPIIKPKEATSWMIKPPHSIKLLRQCETGGVKNINRYNLSFLSRLIGSNEFYFDEIYRFTQQGPIIQQEDKFFLSSGREAYSVYGKRTNSGQCKLYSIGKYLKNSRFSQAKMLTYKAPLYHSVLTPPQQYRPPLFILTDDNHLLHFDFDTGELLDSIYLGSLQRCKFSHIQWETYPNTIVINSNEISRNKKFVNYMIVMSILPLKFIACIKIDSEVFTGQKSPLLSDGLLTMRGKCPIPDKILNIFSRDHILTGKNFLFQTDIGQRCPGGVDDCDECVRSDFRIVGRDGHGLPVNVVVKDMPPTLLTVKSSYELFEYGSWPYHIIYSPPGGRDTCIVKSLLDPRPIENGTIQYDNFIEDGQKLMFHFDPIDGRILSLDCHTLTFFRLINHKLTKCFVLSCTPLTYLEKFQRRLRHTRKKSLKDDKPYKSIYGHINDPNTDIYCLMGTDISSSKLDKPVICLFDNHTGKPMKKFTLKFEVDETSDYDINLDCDLLTINECKLSKQSRFFCYRLTRKKPDDL